MINQINSLRSSSTYGAKSLLLALYTIAISFIILVLLFILLSAFAQSMKNYYGGSDIGIRVILGSVILITAFLASCSSVIGFVMAMIGYINKEENKTWTERGLLLNGLIPIGHFIFVKFIFS